MLHDERPYWPALLGGCCGVAAATCIGFVWATQVAPLSPPMYAFAAALPPAGAVIGYNIGRPADASYGGFEQRLEMPRMEMTMTHDELNRPVSGVRCDLVSLKF